MVLSSSNVIMQDQKNIVEKALCFVLFVFVN